MQRASRQPRHALTRRPLAVGTAERHAHQTFKGVVSRHTRHK
ncbi:hypothetical protein BIFDEN_01709 [Bifidobacterium dentium ATCC 27678]|nr:hypothetical protein BIFDEN_01709 [Bifidobacterium dentium ATCC 27678]